MPLLQSNRIQLFPVWRKLKRLGVAQLLDGLVTLPLDSRNREQLEWIALSHHGGACSFETFLERYELDDPVLWDIARIVHEADLADLGREPS